MVILAVSREAFDRNYYKLGHKDMKVAAIDIQEKATGESINKALKKAGIEEIIINSGQHYDYNMSLKFINELGLPYPDTCLDNGWMPITILILQIP